jgi:ABC-2 type transport system permease protein
MDLSVLGDTLERICYLLPFAHSIQLARDVLAGDYSTFTSHFWWSAGYMFVALGLALFAFVRMCKR